MAKIFDRVKFNVPSTPGTGDITIGTRYDNSFYLPAEEGAVDGDEVYYVIQKSNKDMEVGIGTIASSATVIERTTVLSSIIGGTDGTTKINIDGSAFMALVTPAYALKSMRNVRTVTGTTDTIADGDGGSVVSYNSASAVAVSIAQAGAAGAFLKGWFAFVRNINAGAVTYTPTTSTINGAATLVLASGDSAMIVSDGTNYQAVVWRGIDTDGTLAANSDTRIPSQKAVKTYVDGKAQSVVVQVIASSGTYTPTPGMHHAVIECVGGGGGGGGCASAAAAVFGEAAGGGAGAYTRHIATATDIGASQTVTIGTGGAGGTAGNNAGTAGGTTSVGTLCTAGGGAAGAGNAGTVNAISAGGAGGAAGTGSLSVAGQPGSNTLSASSTPMPSVGGNGPFGAGGSTPFTVTTQTGATGSGRGSGGGGGRSVNTNAAAAGGSGSDGLVVITEYINL